MKHFMRPGNTILRETHTNDFPSSQSSPNLSSSKSKTSRRQKSTKENAPPPDSNSLQPSPSPAKIKSPFPPRPPNPLKRKLGLESFPESVVPGVSDSGVKVAVRVRPLSKEEEGEMIVQKITNGSLSINGQTMTFDSVADMEATQLDVFQLVGVPVVENCLFGFNSSVFAYGQTGSGKTYTMWGPTNALLEENLSSDQRGLTPRVVERLFSRINDEQIKHADKQLHYQCRCSFLEIYNEQISDLLNPSQINLQIREDVKSGVYVENLTEEYVCTMKDVTQLLRKGLSNRRKGATSVNAESSRSHSVFTCVVESRCKSKSDGISRFKSSRINLVDLAGSERQKSTRAAGERLKEAGNINRSLSQLGNLINILAEVSQTGKQRHIPYRDSRLTFLLQESLGGNAKLAMICAISPAQSCKSETFSTLRFAQRAKAIKNRAVVNEVTQDDVNYLRDVIRQLRDELQRMKANGQNATDSNGVHSSGWARRSLNILRSFHHPMTLPCIDDDGDEEMEIDDDAVEKLCNHVDLQLPGFEDRHEIKEDIDMNMEGIAEQLEDRENEIMTVEPVTKSSDLADDMKLNHNIVEPNGEENSYILIVGTSDGDSCRHPPEGKETITSSVSESLDAGSLRKTAAQESSCPIFDPLCAVPVDVKEPPDLSGNESVNCASPSGLSDIPSEVSPVPKSPTPSVSPRISNSRKSLRTSSMLTASQKDLKDSRKLGSEAIHMSFDKSKIRCISEAPSMQSGKSFMATTEHLAASLHHGLEVIDRHRHSSAFSQSVFRFSFRTVDFKPVFPVENIDVGVQTSRDDGTSEEAPVSFLGSSCKNKVQLDVGGQKNSSSLHIVPVDGPESSDTSKQVPKAVKKVLVGAIRREMVLEEFCAKQTSEIKHLNRLVQQYKHERECNAIISQTREDKILRLESLMDGVLPTEEFVEEEFASLTHENKLLKEKYDNHPEVLRTKIELKRVQDELEHYRNFCDHGEKEVLLEEIQDLRSQLQYYIDSSSSFARKRNSLLQLTSSCEPILVPSLRTVLESTKEIVDEKFVQERTRWTEMESGWISLAEELRNELEASISLTEKQKHELDTEKRCVEELKEAMQMVMEGNARMLEQYADLEEKHIRLLARHRKIQEGIEDVKKAATKAGVRGAESRFINVLAAEISALKVAREKERHYLKDENKGLQTQLRDTAEAVQAAGELLVRLKEAEEAVAAAQRRAEEAEQETVKAYKQVEQLKKKHEVEVTTMVNEIIAESRVPKEAAGPAHGTGMAKYDVEEFQQFYTDDDRELAKLAEPSSWFSGYDRCNI